MVEQKEVLLVDDGEDPNFEIIHHLVEYCRFKQAAKTLGELHDQQNGYYQKGFDTSIQHPKRPLGIEHLSLGDLAQLFQEVLEKSVPKKGVIQEEEWQISHKIEWIRDLLRLAEQISFFSLFEGREFKEEMIVIFLAILELMKNGELCIVKEIATQIVWCCRKGEGTK